MATQKAASLFAVVGGDFVVLSEDPRSLASRGENDDFSWQFSILHKLRYKPLTFYLAIYIYTLSGTLARLVGPSEFGPPERRKAYYIQELFH